jgi:hypothetical protein
MDMRDEQPGQKEPALRVRVEEIEVLERLSAAAARSPERQLPAELLVAIAEVGRSARPAEPALSPD